VDRGAGAGPGAARTLLAGGRPVPAVPILPRYWTYQLGLRIEVCGELDPKADIEVQELRPGKKDVAKAACSPRTTATAS
jgi:hypothetical protein